MNIDSINSSAMDVLNNVANALTHEVDARQSPPVTPHASPFDDHGGVTQAGGVASAALGSGENLLSKMAHGLTPWLVSAMAAIPLAGPALAALMPDLQRN